MLRNYIKIALRYLYRYKTFSAINIFGLATGMTCCILILAWVQDELSYDRFNQKAASVYRVVENQYYAHGGVFPVAVTPAPLAAALKDQYPEVEKSSRVTFRFWTLGTGKKIFNQDIALVDPDFPDIFTLNVIDGDPKTALESPRGLVLTRETAVKYFGGMSPVGKTLRINNRDDFQVAAVVEKLPDNTHFDFDCLLSMNYLAELGMDFSRWGLNSYYTYVLLGKDTDVQDLDRKIINIIKKNNEDSVTEIYLQPLTDIHLHSAGKFAADIGGHGDIQYVRIFTLIAFFVLLIACINFMNLSTARSEKRAREVGLRKVIGARRSQLIRQFFSETAVLSMIAFMLALLFSDLLMPVFNSISGKQLSLDLTDHSFLPLLAGVALLTGIIAGSYPALFLSSFQPVETLKGNLSGHPGRSWFRRFLVVLQFTLSVVMIVGTLVVSQQMRFIHDKKIGLDKENLAYLRLSGHFRDKRETARAELLQNPGITDITFTSQLPVYVGSSTSGWDWEGKNPEDEVLMHYLSVDPDYLQTLKMEMAQGRFFSRDFASDSLSVVINETAAAMMNLNVPVGKRLSLSGTDMTITGIVKDFHFKPVYKHIEPMVLINNEKWNSYNYMIIRYRPETLKETLAFIEGVYKQFNHETPFSINFVDQQYERLYRGEQQTGRLSGYMAVLAIVIACLGLYGLASYVTERKIREVAIRKVFGATVPAVFRMVSFGLLQLVFAAILIAWPLAYFIASDWLQNFAYHTELSWWVFILAGMLTLIISMMTVSTQTLRAATANPAKVLRYE